MLVKLCTTSLGALTTKVSGARTVCSTERGMVTGPTRETR